jgi:prevent-host-death family protein
MEVGIRELKQRLSRYIERVREGDTLIVTDRGKPVARIEPIARRQLPAGLRALIDAGLTEDKGPMRDLLDPYPMLPGDDNKTTTDYVREQRR